MIDFHVLAVGRKYTPAATKEKLRAEVLWTVKYEADFTSPR